MSLIVTVNVEEGIVMASDSRLTINLPRDVNGQAVLECGASQSDTIYKTFLAKNGIGISMYGAATINGIPISGYIESFINEKMIEGQTSVDEVPQLLVEYFQAMPNIPDTGFHIAGYKTVDEKRVKKVYKVLLLNGTINNVVPDQLLHGSIWDGESDVLIRVINPNLHFSEDMVAYSPVTSHSIPFEMFTLQDAIDFAVYAIKTTADTMRFQMRTKTVGGPIDVLVIKQHEAFWVQRKSLHI